MIPQTRDEKWKEVSHENQENFGKVCPAILTVSDKENQTDNTKFFTLLQYSVFVQTADFMAISENQSMFA